MKLRDAVKRALAITSVGARLSAEDVIAIATLAKTAEQLLRSRRAIMDLAEIVNEHLNQGDLFSGATGTAKPAGEE